MCSVVHIAPGASAADAHGSRGWIHMYILDARQIDHQAVVTHSQAAGVVSPAPNRNPQTLFTAEVNGSNHVGDVSALGDQTRFAADHGVINFARFLVTRIVRFDQLSAQLSFELIKRFLLHGLPPDPEYHGFDNYSATAGVPNPF